jgi:hypothetical protein
LALAELESVVVRLVDDLQDFLCLAAANAAHAEIETGVHIRDTALAGFGSGDVARCPVELLGEPVGRQTTVLSNALQRGTHFAPASGRLKFTHASNVCRSGMFDVYPRG